MGDCGPNLIRREIIVIKDITSTHSFQTVQEFGFPFQTIHFDRGNRRLGSSQWMNQGGFLSPVACCCENFPSENKARRGDREPLAQCGGVLRVAAQAVLRVP